MIKLLLLREVNATSFKCLAALAQTMQRQMRLEKKVTERTEHDFRCSICHSAIGQDGFKMIYTLTLSPESCCFQIWRVESDKTLGTRLVCALPRHSRHVVSQIPQAHTRVSLLRNRNVMRVCIIMGILVTVINGSKIARKLLLYFLPCLPVMQQRFSLVSLRYLWLSLLNLHILKVKNGHPSNRLMRERS